jgi:hypothetical protein
LLDTFDLNSGIPSDSASLLFLNNPNLYDDDEESEQFNDEEEDSDVADEDVNDDVQLSVENRNRVLQVTVRIRAYNFLLII